MTTSPPAKGTDTFRNWLAFFLISAFVAVLPLLFFFEIPKDNKDIVTYMAGQLSGMALMALGFYFTNKAGQDALDVKRSETTGKLADAITATASSTATEPDVILEPGETAQAKGSTQ